MKRPQNGTETKVTHSRVEVSRLLISFPYLELLHTIVTFPYSYIYAVTQCDIPYLFAYKPTSAIRRDPKLFYYQQLLDFTEK